MKLPSSWHSCKNTESVFQFWDRLWIISKPYVRTWQSFFEYQSDRLREANNKFLFVWIFDTFEGKAQLTKIVNLVGSGESKISWSSFHSKHFSIRTHDEETKYGKILMLKIIHYFGDIVYFFRFDPFFFFFFSNRWWNMNIKNIRENIQIKHSLIFIEVVAQWWSFLDLCWPIFFLFVICALAWSKWSILRMHILMIWEK